MNACDEALTQCDLPLKTAAIPVELSASMLDSLSRIAEQRGVSCCTLIETYIGEGLRRDMAGLLYQQRLEAIIHITSAGVRRN